MEISRFIPVKVSDNSPKSTTSVTFFPVHCERIPSDRIFIHKQRKLARRGCPGGRSSQLVLFSALCLAFSAATSARISTIITASRLSPLFSVSAWMLRVSSFPSGHVITHRPIHRPLLLWLRDPVPRRRLYFSVGWKLLIEALCFAGSAAPLPLRCRCPVNSGSLPLHIIGDVSIDVQRSGAGDVTDDGEQGLDNHPMLRCVGGEQMTQIVEADAGETILF